jgi:HPt (histidine-containing phosphotransfer) domain-containing protein
MTAPSGRSDFFAREAGDYLRELEPLLGGTTQPPGEAFERLARALRGAAMLAGPTTFTQAARELEQLAKMLRGGTLGWADAGPGLRQAVAEFQRLVGFARTWDDARDHEATLLTEALGRVAETATAPAMPAVPTTPAGSEGIRSYVAREAAAVAESLDLAARVLETDPMASAAPLAAATRAMQSLRGLAGLTDLAPLADVLDAVDAALGELERAPVVPEAADALFTSAAAAVARLARDVAEIGRPGPELPEVDGFTTRLFEVFGGREGVVSVEALLATDGLAIQPYGGEAGGPRAAEPLDLASLGERLRQSAAQLRAAASAQAVRLQAFVLLTILREAPGGLGRRPAGPLIASLIAALDTGAAAADPGRFAAVLDQAGLRLTQGARDDIHALDHDLLQLAEAVQPDAAAAGETDIVPIESLLIQEQVIVGIEELLLEEEPVVPIESLLADEPVPIEWLAPDESPVTVPADRNTLERSLSNYSRLRRTNAPVIPFDALVPPAVAPSPREPVAPIDFGPPTGVATPPAPAIAPPSMHHDLADALGVVPIEDLLYTGKGALERADAVRRELETALRMASSELDRLDPLVRELLDLVPLSLVDYA